MIDEQVEQHIDHQSKKNQLKFPVQRVKKIVQENQEVGKINNVVPYVLTKSLEIFLADVLTKCQVQLKAKKISKATPGLLKTVINESKYDFMKEFVQRLPDLEECGHKKKKARAVSEESEVEKVSRRVKRVKGSEDEY